MTGTLGQLALAVAVFLASHVIPAVPPLRRALLRMLGKPVYHTAYSVLSLAVLTWVAIAYRAAPYVEVWPEAPWTRWVPLLLMPVACVLAVGGLTTPNPFSVGPGARRYDTQRPGLLRLTRHPVLWGTVLWAASHMVANGDAASLLVFGPMLVLGWVGMPLLDLKTRRALGTDWHRLAAATGHPRGISLAEVKPWRIGTGLAVYAILLWLHPYLFGVSPLTMFT